MEEGGRAGEATRIDGPHLEHQRRGRVRNEARPGLETACRVRLVASFAGPNLTREVGLSYHVWVGKQKRGGGP